MSDGTGRRRSPRAFRIAPLLLALFAPGLASAATAVVPPLVPKGIDAKVAGNVTGLLSSELDFSGAYETVTELPAAPSSLNEKCLSSTSCLAGIAKAAGADAVLTGSVAPGPQGLQVYLVLFDATKGTIKNKATFDIAADPASLADSAGKWVKQLVSGQSPAAAVAAAAPPPSFEEEEEEDGFEFDAKTPAKPTSTSKSSSSSSKTATKTRIDTSSTPRELVDDEEAEEPEEDDSAAVAAAAAKAKADAAAKAKADAAAKAKAEADAAAASKAKAEADAKARAEAAAKAQAKADAERRAREDAERLVREEEEAEEQRRQEARAKAEAARRAKEAPTRVEPEESSGDDEDFSFGSSVATMAIETEGADEEEEEEEEAPAPRASSSTASRSSSSASRSTSGSSSSRTASRVEEDEDEDEPVEDEEELPDLDEDEDDRRTTSRSRDDEEEDEPVDFDEEPRSTSRSRDLDDDDDDRRSASRSSSSSSSSRSSGRSTSFDEGRGSSRSSTRIEREDQKPGINLAGRVGYSRYYEYNFVTYGAELAIPVADVVQIIAGVEGFSTQRQYSDKVVQQLAIEQGVDVSEINPSPWQTIIPISFGVLYKSSKNAVRPYGGVDLTLTPYTQEFDLAIGARARAGADFMVAKSFGLNLNLSAGFMWGEKFDETQADVKDFGIIPQVSGGTVFQF